MSKNYSMILYINDKKISINIPYNYNTTFNDALEIISYSFPEFNVCPCFAFQYRLKYSYSQDWKNKDINEKLSDLNCENNYFRITKHNKSCKCNEIIKENYKKSKIEIIKVINQINNNLKEKKREINDLNNQNKNLENTNISLKKENENLNLNISKLNKVENENMKLKSKNKSYEEKINRLENDIKSLNFKF